jgi:hypothetical protein
MSRPTRGEMTAPRLGARRVALGIFVAIEAFAFVFYMLLGRFAWFSQDEWDFLADRTAWDVGDLFRPHNEHWSTLPILVFRLLWVVVGVQTYVPYLAITIALYLTVAALLRILMRRAGVGPWVSTAAATTFALFGTGYHNIDYSFQMAWGATLVFGLCYVMLVDHAGAFDRRDWIGLGLGLAALMTAGLALTLIAAAAITVFLRRGWRQALLHVGPLGGVYVIWFIAIGHEGYVRRASLGAAFRFTVRALSGTFDAIGQLPGVGVALFGVLVLGLAIAWIPRHGEILRERAAAPVALLLGSVLFLFTTGFGRGNDFAHGIPPLPASRYRDVAAALLLPALAVAADVVARRSKILMPIMCALFLIGVPGNLRIAADRAPDWREYKKVVLSTLHLPISPELPDWVRPERAFNPWLTVGWLRAGVASGRVPRAPIKMTPAFIAVRSRDLALQPAPSQHLRSCRRVSPGTTRVLSRDEPFRVLSGDVSVVYQVPGGAASSSRRLDSETYVAVAGPLLLRVAPGAPGDAVVCG